MEFSIDLPFLQEKLALVSRAVSAHSPMPILSGVLIELRPDCMVLIGSSNDFIIRTRIEPDEKNRLEIIDPGSMAVDARILGELLRRMTGPSLSVITLDDSLMRLKGSDGNFDLVGFSGADYPAVVLDQPETKLTLPCELLAQIESQVSYATSTQDVRPVLTGINLQAKNGILAATATDSYRLARKVVPLEGTEDFSITIPASSFSETVKSISGVRTIDMYINRKKAQFVFDSTIIQTQLIEGTYPDAARIIPDRFISTLTVSARDMEGMLSRSSIYTTQASTTGSIVPVRMDFTTESVGLQVLTSTIGSCRQQLENVKYEGQDLAVSFNAKLVLDAIHGLNSSDLLEFGFTGELRPIRITNPADPTLTMVVVPIRSS